MFINGLYVGLDVFEDNSMDALKSAQNVARDFFGVVDPTQVSCHTRNPDGAFERLIAAARASLTPEQKHMSVAELVTASNKPAMPPSISRALFDLS